MTPKSIDRRSSEGLQIRIPIRVLGFDYEYLERGFSEDTHTLLVSRSGASIALHSPVFAGDSLRIANLTNYNEANFRVVGRLSMIEDGVTIWAVECLERRDDFWDVEWPPPGAEGPGDNISLQCRACSTKASYPLTLMESEVLGSTGVIILNCARCGKSTYWVNADPGQRPNSFPVGDAVAPPVRMAGKTKEIIERAAKRSRLRLPILVRNQADDREVSRTIDISKLGLAAILFMNLDIGETVKIVCPYDFSSGGIEQTAEVRWRSRYYNDDLPRTYGLRFVH